MRVFVCIDFDENIRDINVLRTDGGVNKPFSFILCIVRVLLI